MRTFRAVLLTVGFLSFFFPSIARGAGAELSVHERAMCQAAIEQVYWSHRSWPDQNPGPKPSLRDVLSGEELYKRAEYGLRKSAALETLWHRSITPADLQAEIDRMARQSRRPAMLRELFASLGNDPYRVAECLARPILADRLLRNLYGYDARFHAPVKALAESDRAALRTTKQLRAANRGSYREIDVAANDLDVWFAGQDDRRVGAVTTLREDEDRFFVAGVLRRDNGNARIAVVAWAKRPFEDWWNEVSEKFIAPLPFGTGATYRLPNIDVVACSNDNWDPMAFRPPALTGHVAVWTGAEMIIWGGTNTFVVGGRYDPAVDTWHPLSIQGEPQERTSHTAVWTGTEAIVWGGWGFLSSSNVLASGGRYNPTTDSWTATPASGAPQARTGHASIWTGSEMVVWGGCTTFGCDIFLTTGGRYNPISNTWSETSTAGAPAGRAGHTAVWTGSEMIVWGGCGNFSCSTRFDNGGRYTPATDTWSAVSMTGAPEGRSQHTAVWTGSEMIVWGGCTASAGCYSATNTGGRYAPATNTWTATSTALAPEGRREHIAAWAPTAEKMVIWGGCANVQCSSQWGNGGRYDPVANTWTPTSNVNAPSPRASATAVWTGSEVIVWGGCYSGECQLRLNSGGRYNPVTDSWIATGLPNDPARRLNHTSVWTGAEMIVWGGFEQSMGLVLTGRRYDPATDTWTGMTPTGLVGARDGHNAVWTGTEMIVWGGREAGIGTNITGGRYDPTSDTWQETNTTGAPDARAFHTGVWTGTEMIVWGGCAFDACDSYLNTGGRYRPATDTWTLTTTTNAPSARIAHRAAWTGSEMIVWGGAGAGLTPQGDGARYDPLANSWSPIVAAGAPSPRFSHSAAWTGSAFMIWGGTNGSTVLGGGALYHPVTNSWTPVGTTGAPAARQGATAVWTGAEVIVWGGCLTSSCGAFNPEDLTRTGGRYDPAASAWTATSTLGAPAARDNHTALWDGSQMLVWGGWYGSSSTVFSTGASYCANAVVIPAPNIVVTPNPLSFGAVGTGASGSGTVTVSNSGTATLAIASVTAPSAPFAITADGCGGQLLSAGASCQIIVSFSPSAAGGFSGSFTVHSNDPDQPAIVAGLSGQGVAAVLSAASLSVADANANAIVEPGEAADIRPSWHNGSTVAAIGVTGNATVDASAFVTDGGSAYGTFAPGDTRGCMSTNDCYGIVANGTRPGQHWDVMVSETLSTGQNRTWPVHIAGSFADVPLAHPFLRFVETMLHRGITAGCGGNNFCPDSSVTRAQMAVFILTSAFGNQYQPAACSGTFADVACPSSFANWIEDLYARGITAGCATNPLRFCPDAAVTRGQMAVFLLRGKEGAAYTPPACSGVFEDVTCPGTFTPWIEELFQRGVAAGCAAQPARFCPSDPATRGQMSVFITRTFALQLYP